MKRISFIGLLLFLGLITVSCNKEKKGYTIDDIVGEYTFSKPPTLLKDLKRKSTFISVMMPSLPLPGTERILWILGFHALMRTTTPILMVRLSRMRTIPLS